MGIQKKKKYVETSYDDLENKLSFCKVGYRFNGDHLNKVIKYT